MRRVVLFVLAALAAWPSAASAHSIIRVRGSDIAYTSSDATSTNSLTVRVSGQDIEFRDPTVDGGIDYGSCRPGETDANGYVIQAFCPRGGVTLLRVDLGEREDALQIGLDVATQAIGGPGADRLTTAAAADVLVGGDGNDTLDSGAGDDNVIAGAGDDTVATGEGNDKLQAGAGADTLDAGGGDDDVKVRDGIKDVVTCGGGTDNVDADTLDEVAGDCERVIREVASAGSDGGATGPDTSKPRVSAGAVTLQKLGRRGLVRVFATSTEAGAVAGSGFVEMGGVRLPLRTDRRAVVVAGGGVTLTARLSAAAMRQARRALRRRRKVMVRLGIVATDAAGNSSETRAPAIRLTR